MAIAVNGHPEIDRIGVSPVEEICSAMVEKAVALYSARRAISEFMRYPDVEKGLISDEHKERLNAEREGLTEQVAPLCRAISHIKKHNNGTS